MKLVETYDTFFLLGIPVFNSTNLNEARRFITFIDILFDNKKVLYCQAQSHIEGLFQFESNLQAEEVFAAHRTVSRLYGVQKWE